MLVDISFDRIMVNIMVISVMFIVIEMILVLWLG